MDQSSKSWDLSEIRNVRELLFAQRDRVCRRCMIIGAGLVVAGVAIGFAVVVFAKLVLR